MLVGTPDNGFGGGPYDELFFELSCWIYDDALPVRTFFEAIVGNDGTFFGKSCYVGCLAAEVRFGNKKGEVSIHMAGSFEGLV